MSRILILSALLLALLPQLALAAEGKAIDTDSIVWDAEDINSQHCQELRGADASAIGKLVTAVGGIYGRVAEGYQATGKAELLFWRGVLAMCMGLNDNAEQDFLEFIRDNETDPTYTDMITQARTRLRRLGSNSTFIEGDAAKWTARPSASEFEVRYAGGSGIHVLGCTDAETDEAGNPRSENGSCIGQRNAGPSVAVAVAPLSLGLGAAFYGTPAVGFRFDVDADVPIPLSQSPGRQQGTYNPAVLPANYGPSPRASISLGPAFRSVTTATAATELNAAHYFKISPAFGVNFTPLKPMAGHAAYGGEQGLLDTALLGLLQMGLHVRWEGGIEVGQKLSLAMGGEVQAHAPMPAAAVPVLSEAGTVTTTVEVINNSYENFEESVEIMPDLGLTTSMEGSFWIRLLRPVNDSAKIAVGPQLLINFGEASAGYPNDIANRWCIQEGVAVDACKANMWRKVYSTLRMDMYVQLGIVARFGSARKATRPGAPAEPEATAPEAAPTAP